MKHLVLGSAGQIGGHLCKYLRDNNQEVITFDIRDHINEDLREIPNFHLHECLKKCDFVHFLAFDVGGAKYLEKHQDTNQFISNNMKIMSNTFEQIKNLNKPFIFASSQMSELNHSSYGVLKLLGEKMTKDLGGTVVRFWNVYGQEPEGEHSHVITDLCKMAKYQKEIKVRTDGTEKRQFIHADDASKALVHIAGPWKNMKSPYGKEIDVTSGQWVSIKILAGIIGEIAGLGTEDIYYSDKKDQTQKDAQNEAKNLFPLGLQYSLEEGIKLIYDKI